MSQDIINRLLPFIHDETRMPAGMIKDVIEEIERLRNDVAGLRKIVDGRFSSTTETVWRRDDFWR